MYFVVLLLKHLDWIVRTYWLISVIICSSFNPSIHRYWQITLFRNVITLSNSTFSARRVWKALIVLPRSNFKESRKNWSNFHFHTIARSHAHSDQRPRDVLFLASSASASTCHTPLSFKRLDFVTFSHHLYIARWESRSLNSVTIVGNLEPSVHVVKLLLFRWLTITRIALLYHRV